MDRRAGETVAARSTRSDRDQNRDRIKGTVTANPENAASHSHPRRSALIAGAIVAGALAGLAGVYGIGGVRSEGGDPGCRPAVDNPPPGGPPSRGEGAGTVAAPRAAPAAGLSLRRPRPR